jgi:hypothetical protein
MVEPNKNKWPKLANQYRWSVITGISIQTIQKHRERGTLIAKEVRAGRVNRYWITRENMIEWMAKYYRPTTGVSVGT